MSEEPHDLKHFLKMSSEDIASEYRRIRQRSTEDPGTAGDEGEEDWRELLEEWLPKQYSVVTKGRILNFAGRLSPQVDVIILKPSYPAGLIGKKVYLAAGVAAAFECKITLRKRNIAEVFENSIAIRKLLRCTEGTPFGDLNHPIIYGLLAHSHEWRESSEAATKISEEINKIDLATITRPHHMPNIFCIADVGTWIGVKHWFQYPTDQGMKWRIGTGYSLCRLTTDPFHTPIGRFMYALLRCLAWQDVSLRQIADYFEAVPDLGGAGECILREWPQDTLSRETLKGLATGRRGRTRWDDWSTVFP